MLNTYYTKSWNAKLRDIHQDVCKKNIAQIEEKYKKTGLIYSDNSDNENNDNIISYIVGGGLFILYMFSICMIIKRTPKLIL
jgi:hypothetical protein